MIVRSIETAVPLCVDLDGTLIRSDLLLESALMLVKSNPLYVFRIALWLLLRGKAALKAEIAKRVVLNPAALPYNTEFVEWLRSEREAGRSLWLCTAANERLAAAVALHLDFFDGVIASDGATNLAGAAKAAQLAEQFGERGFDYCGNERRDLAIWQRARGAIVVHGGRRLERDAGRHIPILRSFPMQTSTARATLRELRPHQWAKNILILVPLFAAHRAGNLQSLSQALLAVVAFCLCASSVYVLNDLLDLEADRGHPRKSKRPFAAGTLSLAAGLVLAPCLLAAAVALAIFLPWKFQLVFTTYYTLTLAYSFALKGLAIIDALVLAGLYTLRIIAGAAAVSVPLSFWLLLFAVFLFLSLAFVKRFAELDALRRAATSAGSRPRLPRGRLADSAESRDRRRVFERARACALHKLARHRSTLPAAEIHLDALCAHAVLGEPGLDEGTARRNARRSCGVRPQGPCQSRSRSAGSNDRGRGCLRCIHASSPPGETSCGASTVLCRLRDRHASFPDVAPFTSVLPYGNGRSYGDSCLNVGAGLLATRTLDRFIDFDPHSGIVTCESGVLLADILHVAMPKGWFVPVTPGTRFVTVGGAIANDVHGKNHHRAGTFSRHVRRFELLRSDGQRLLCSDSENTEWSQRDDRWARPDGGDHLGGDRNCAASLAHGWMWRPSGSPTSMNFWRCAPNRIGTSNTRSPGWIAWDGASSSAAACCNALTMRRPRQLGRAILRGESRCPFAPPISLVNGASLRLFNTAYYHRQRGAASPKRRAFRVVLLPARWDFALEPAIRSAGAVSISVRRARHRSGRE